MISKAVLRYIRISPKKVRLLTRPLQGLPVQAAYAILTTTNKKASRIIGAVLKSAVANARKKGKDVDEVNLYISKIVADSGPMLKRYRAASMGRASTIRKRTSHITIHLDEKERAVKKSGEAKRGIGKRAIFKKRARVNNLKRETVKAKK